MERDSIVHRIGDSEQRRIEKVLIIDFWVEIG
jgi:hypothetical protein